MKKIISKITTLVLIVAMLLPFASIPKVSADTTECSAGETPEYHTNYYFFLQAETEFDWPSMFKDEATDARTAYWTGFLYNFPSDGSKIVFESEGFVPISDSTSFSNDFYNHTDGWTGKEFYTALKNEGMSSTYSGTNTKDYAFENKGTGTSSNRIISYMYHGNWAHLNTSNNNSSSSATGPTKDSNGIYVNLNDLNVKSESLNVLTANIDKLVKASIFINPDASSLSYAKIGSGTLTSDELTLDSGMIQKAIKHYNKDGDGLGVVNKKNGVETPIISVAIERNYNLYRNVFNKNSSYKVKTSDSTQSTVVGSNTFNGQVTLSDNELLNYKVNSGSPDSHTYMHKDGTMLSDIESFPLQGTDGKTYYWVFAPTLYQMSYYVCKASNEATGDTVTITYDGNGNGDTVNNVPGADTINKGNDYTVSNQKPTRSGYTFKNWNTDPACKSGKTIEPSAKLTNLQNNTTLYACWGATGTKDSPGTGVLTYAGLFTGIIAIAGGAYYVVKKKNLFKKI